MCGRSRAAGLVACIQQQCDCASSILARRLHSPSRSQRNLPKHRPSRAMGEVEAKRLNLRSLHSGRSSGGQHPHSSSTISNTDMHFFIQICLVAIQICTSRTITDFEFPCPSCAFSLSQVGTLERQTSDTMSPTTQDDDNARTLARRRSSSR